MSKRTKRRARLDPDKAIADSANLPAHQLIDLIHRINPTGLALSGKDMEARYRQKCDLQNRLIAQFKEQVRIVSDPNQSGIIAIHYQGRDACHARLSELDTDVRAWAQRYLDDHRFDREATVAPATTGKPVRHGRSAPADQTRSDLTHSDLTRSDNQTEKNANDSVDDLLNSGRTALEAYDFETARHLFRTATERSKHEPIAAVTYLAFLVDTLGDYAAVLEIEKTLSRAVRSTPEVRELLGMAAAGREQTALAESYLKRCTGQRAAEAYRTLCANAISRQEVDRAEDFLQQARQREAEESEPTRKLSEAIDALRRQLRQPLEQTVQQLFSAGELDRAGECARHCLAQWPDSRVAQTILDKIEHQHTEQTIQALIGRARTELKQHAYSDALQHFQRALQLGCSAATLGDEFLLAQRAAEKHNDRAQLEDLRQRLSRPDATDGLLAYLTTSPALRTRVRTELKLPTLQWLETMDAASSGSKARKAVSAVLALQQAMDALDCGSIEHAANLLSQHQKLLGTLTEAQQAWKTIEDTQSQARDTAVHRALADARRAIQDGRREVAFRLLDPLDQRQLTEPEKKEVTNWLHELQQQEQQNTLRKRIDSLLSEDQPFAARQMLDRLIDATPTEARQGLLDERRRLADRIDREWRIPLELAPDPAHVLQHLNLTWFGENVNTWLSPDSDDILVAYPVGKALFVCLVDPVAETVPRHAVIETPEQWQAPIDSMVHEGRVWLIGAEGNMLELTLDTWGVQRFESLRHYISRDDVIDGIYFCPDDRFCWIESRSGTWSSHLRLIDLKHRREHRSFSGFHMTPTRVIGARGLLLVRDESSSTVGLYNSSGQQLHDCADLNHHSIANAISSENGESMVILSYQDGDRDCDFPLIVSVVDRRGKASLRYRISGSHKESICSLALLEDIRLIFVLYGRPDRTMRLMALQPLSEHLETVYEITIPTGSTLVSNERSAKVKLLTSRIDGSIQVTALGRHRPRLRANNRHDEIKIPQLAPPLFCAYSSVASATALPRRIASASDTQLLNWFSKRVDQYNYDSEQLSGLVLGLVDADRTAVIINEVDRQLKKGKAALIWTYAAAMLDKECWEEAIRVLRPRLPAPDEWEEHRSAHYAHLLGIALYRSGRVDEALTVWQQAPGFTGMCVLQPYIDLATYFVENDTHRDDTKNKPLVHRLIERLEEANRLLEAEDDRAVIHTLDCPLVWLARERQSLARLVFSLLRENSETPYDNFIRLMAVTCLLEESDPDNPISARLYFPGEWDQARLDAVVAQARAWSDHHLSRNAGK